MYDNENMVAYCRECHVPYRAVTPQDLMIYLHSWCYEGPDFVFKTSLPKWCSEYDEKKIEEAHMALKKYCAEANENSSQVPPPVKN